MSRFFRMCFKEKAKSSQQVLQPLTTLFFQQDSSLEKAGPVERTCLREASSRVIDRTKSRSLIMEEYTENGLCTWPWLSTELGCPHSHPRLSRTSPWGHCDALSCRVHSFLRTSIFFKLRVSQGIGKHTTPTRTYTHSAMVTSCKLELLGDLFKHSVLFSLEF